MAKHFSAVLQKIATNIRSLASDNKQKPSYKNVKKYLGSILSENKTPAKQKQVNLTLKCLSSLFTLKKNSFINNPSLLTLITLQSFIFDQYNCAWSWIQGRIEVKTAELVGQDPENQRVGCCTKQCMGTQAHEKCTGGISSSIAQ